MFCVWCVCMCLCSVCVWYVVCMYVVCVFVVDGVGYGRVRSHKDNLIESVWNPSCLVE